MRERRFAAESAGDVGENSFVDGGGEMWGKRGIFREPKRGLSGWSGVAGVDDVVVQDDVGNKYVIGTGVLGGEGIEEGGVGADLFMEVGEAKIFSEFGARLGAADGEETGDFQAAGVSGIGGGGVAGDQASEGNANNVYFGGIDWIG